MSDILPANPGPTPTLDDSALSPTAAPEGQATAPPTASQVAETLVPPSEPLPEAAPG